MERLTLTTEKRALMGIDYPTYFGPDLCKEYDERLKAYEDTGLEPEQIERIVDAYGRGHTLRSESALRLEIIRDIETDQLRELAQAEKEGRLVVLPCSDDTELLRDGETYKANHWNCILTAFCDDPTTKSGRRLGLFTVKEIEAALKGEG